MDNALTKTREIHATANLVWPRGVAILGIGLMQEYQIKIRAIRKLAPTELAVGNYPKSQWVFVFAFTRGGTAIALLKLAANQLDGLVHHQLGNGRQPFADLLHIDHRRNIGGGETQLGRM